MSTQRQTLIFIIAPRQMVLSNKGFSRLVIMVFIIYESTHAKNLVIGSIDFS